MTIPAMKITANKPIKQIRNYLLGVWFLLSCLTTFFLFVPMMISFLTPLTRDVSYIEIKPVVTKSRGTASF